MASPASASNKISISWFSKTFCPQSTAKHILDSNPQHTTTAQRKWARKQWSIVEYSAKFRQTHTYNSYRTTNQKKMLPIVTFEQYWEKHNKTKQERGEQYERSLMAQEEPKIIRQVQQRREQEQQEQQKQAELSREQRERSLMQNEEKRQQEQHQQEQQKQAEILREQKERSLMQNEEQQQKQRERQEEEREKHNAEISMIMMIGEEAFARAYPEAARAIDHQKHQELQDPLHERQVQRERVLYHRRRLQEHRTRQREKREKKHNSEISMMMIGEQAFARAIEQQNQEKDKENKRQLHHREGQCQRERQLQSCACELQKVRERIRRETWWNQDRLKYGVQDSLVEQLKRQHAQKLYHDDVVQIYREICRNEQERLRQRHQRGLDLEQAWLQLEQQQQQQQFEDLKRDQDGDVYMDDDSNN